METNLLEQTDLSESSTDGFVIKNVKLLGRKSKNGREYTESALVDSVNLFESVPVYVNHSKTQRNYQDRLGYVRNPVARESGIYADFHLNPKHNLSESVLWEAEHKAPFAGFSIQAKGIETKGLVEKIVSVRSVDVVDDPATTKNFFESLQEDEAKLAEETKILTELVEQVKVLKEELDSLKKKPIENKLAALPVNNTEDTYQSWLTKLKENN